MVERFRNGQKVRITDHGSRPELNGMSGTVVRLLMSTAHEAWIHMDSDLPKHCLSFPDPADSRYRNTKVYDDEVEEI